MARTTPTTPRRRERSASEWRAISISNLRRLREAKARITNLRLLIDTQKKMIQALCDVIKKDSDIMHAAGMIDSDEEIDPPQLVELNDEIEISEEI